MRRILIFVLAIFVVGMFTAEVFAQDHAYIGLKKCTMCHKGVKKGEILETWQAGPHAKAFATLGTEESKAIAAEKGIEDPQTADECLRCHITGHGVDATLTESLDLANGVTCEACHGAGADYKKIPIMKDRDAAITAGLIAAPEDDCVVCHNEESPTYVPFEYEKRWAEIEHRRPPATEE